MGASNYGGRNGTETKTAALYGFFFCLCDKMPGQDDLRKGLFSSWFKGTGSPVGDHVAAGS